MNGHLIDFRDIKAARAVANTRAWLEREFWSPPHIPAEPTIDPDAERRRNAMLNAHADFRTPDPASEWARFERRANWASAVCLAAMVAVLVWLVVA